MSILDFQNMTFDDEDKTSSDNLIEFLLEGNFIHIFYNMQTEMYSNLLKNYKEKGDQLLNYTKEQLEGRNTKGNYIVEVTKVVPCIYNRVNIGYGTSGINLQLQVYFKYRYIEKGVAFCVKAAVDHLEKFSTYGSDIPIYGDDNKEVSGFLVVKNRGKYAEKLLQLAGNVYTKQGLVFPVVTYGLEMKANDRNITITAVPLLPTKPNAFRLTSAPKMDSWYKLQARISLLGEYPKELQQMLAMYTQVDLEIFGLKKDKSFYFDKIGASFGEITKSNVDTVDIDWDTFMNHVQASYISLFNIWNHYRGTDFKKDKYLVEFSKSKMDA